MHRPARTVTREPAATTAKNLAKTRLLGERGAFPYPQADRWDNPRYLGERKTRNAIWFLQNLAVKPLSSRCFCFLSFCLRWSSNKIHLSEAAGCTALTGPALLRVRSTETPSGTCTTAGTTRALFGARGSPGISPQPFKVTAYCFSPPREGPRLSLPLFTALKSPCCCQRLFPTFVFFWRC